MMYLFILTRQYDIPYITFFRDAPMLCIKLDNIPNDHLFLFVGNWGSSQYFTDSYCIYTASNRIETFRISRLEYVYIDTLLLPSGRYMRYTSRTCTFRRSICLDSHFPFPPTAFPLLLRGQRARGKEITFSFPHFRPNIFVDFHLL